MKSIYPVIGVSLVLLGGLAATGRSESKDTKDTKDAKGVLSDAAVFAGPDGKTVDTPARGAGRWTFSATADQATFWKTQGGLESAVKLAKTLTLHQGLPRLNGIKVGPTDEQKKTMFTVDEEWFRAAPQPVSAELAEALRKAVFRGVRERKGAKLCGGFHADVLLKWSGGLLTETEALICFGCQEVKLFGATGALYADLSDDAAKELRELLAPYLKSGDAQGIRDLPVTPGRF